LQCGQGEAIGRRPSSSAAIPLAALRARLEERRTEIEQEVLTRIFALAEPTGAEEAQYFEGMKAAAAAAIDYGLDSIECGAERAGPPPPLLLAQARLAARSGVSLDAVLRRYFAGYAILGDFLAAQTERSPRLDAATLQRALRTQAALFDRLLAAVSAEHKREVYKGMPRSAEQRRAARVEQLLAGELVDTAEISYELDGHHIGLIAAGPHAPETIRTVAAAADRRLLLVDRGEGTFWAWLGGRRPTECEGLADALTAGDASASFAMGERGHGLDGWRLTHRQARAAWSIAVQCPEQALTHYEDVALLASTAQDDVLSRSLSELYLAPLRLERDGGEVLRETLLAYFACARSITSAAALLGVTRQTVRSRLRGFEERVGRSLDERAMEIEIALRLEAIGG
jgi:PucR C-terminal helix-turn-helix domain/GGDEF-like domain